MGFFEKFGFFVFYLQKYDLFDKLWIFTFLFVKILFFCIVIISQTNYIFVNKIQKIRIFDNFPKKSLGLCFGLRFTNSSPPQCEIFQNSKSPSTWLPNLESLVLSQASTAYKVCKCARERETTTPIFPKMIILLYLIFILFIYMLFSNFFFPILPKKKILPKSFSHKLKIQGSQRKIRWIVDWLIIVFRFALVQYTFHFYNIWSQEVCKIRNIKTNH